MTQRVEGGGAWRVYLVCAVHSSMLISGLPQTARENSLTDHSDTTCAGIVAESIPVRMASHCSSISPRRIAVSLSTNSRRLANVTTIESPPGTSETCSTHTQRRRSQHSK